MKKKDRQFISIVKCLDHLYKEIERVDNDISEIPQKMPYGETVRQEMMMIRNHCGKSLRKIKAYCKQNPPITKSQQTAHNQAKDWAKGKWSF